MLWLGILPECFREYSISFCSIVFRINILFLLGCFFLDFSLFFMSWWPLDHTLSKWGHEVMFQDDMFPKIPWLFYFVSLASVHCSITISGPFRLPRDLLLSRLHFWSIPLSSYLLRRGTGRVIVFSTPTSKHFPRVGRVGIQIHRCVCFAPLSKIVRTQF